MFLTSTPSNGGETTAKSACVGLMSCLRVVYRTTNTGFLPSISSIMYSSAARALSLLYQRPLIGLATGYPLVLTRFDSAQFPTGYPALSTYTVSDVDTKTSTAKYSRPQ